MSRACFSFCTAFIPRCVNGAAVWRCRCTALEGQLCFGRGGLIHGTVKHEKFIQRLHKELATPLFMCLSSQLVVAEIVG